MLNAARHYHDYNYMNPPESELPYHAVHAFRIKRM